MNEQFRTISEADLKKAAPISDEALDRAFAEGQKERDHPEMEGGDQFHGAVDKAAEHQHPREPSQCRAAG